MLLTFTDPLGNTGKIVEFVQKVNVMLVRFICYSYLSFGISRCGSERFKPMHPFWPAWCNNTYHSSSSSGIAPWPQDLICVPLGIFCQQSSFPFCRFKENKDKSFSSHSLECPYRLFNVHSGLLNFFKCVQIGLTLLQLPRLNFWIWLQLLKCLLLAKVGLHLLEIVWMYLKLC